MSLTTVTRGRFRLRAVICLKLLMSDVRRALPGLNLPSIGRFKKRGSATFYQGLTKNKLLMT